MKLVRIVSRYFVVGLIIQSNKVTNAAPIVHYMKGWTLEQVLEYCKKRGWKTVHLKEGDS